MTTKRNTGSSEVFALVLLLVVVAAGYLLSWTLDSRNDATFPEVTQNPHAVNLPNETESAGTDQAGGDQSAVDADGSRHTALDDIDTLAEGREEAREEVPNSPNTPASAPPKTLGVSGTVVVLGEVPVEPSEINGLIEVTIWGQHGTVIQVAVENGTFELAFVLDAIGRLRPLRGSGTIQAETDGLWMDFSEPYFTGIGPTTMAESDGTPLWGQAPRLPFGTKDAVVYLVRAPLTRLNVVDRQSGTPLDGVKVVAAQTWRTEGARHPKGIGVESLTDETTSPVTLSPPRSIVSSTSVAALVSAEGYAWEHVTLNLRSGGDRTLELERGGTLRVTIDGNVPPAGRLRLYAEAPGSPISDVKVRDDQPIVYENLAPGGYAVCLELGDWYGSPQKLASQDVVVESNGDVKVDLAFDAVELAPKAEASGVLVVPEGWDIKNYYASVSLLGHSSDGTDQRHTILQRSLKPVAEKPGTYSFTVPPMEIGQYEFGLSPYGWREFYDLPPEGRADLRFEFPEPVEFTVHVIEESTGEPANVERVSWNPVWPKGSRGGGSMTQSSPQSTGLFRFNVTQGKINVSCWSDGYIRVSKTIDARTTNDITLELTRACLATLTLREGNNDIPWPDGVEYDIEPVDGGEGYYHSSSSSGDSRWFGVTKPGRYRIVVPEINGYAPQDPVEFEMLKDEHIEVVIDLVRR